MVRPWLTACMWWLGASACASGSDDAIVPYRGDTAVLQALPDCMAMKDRPPGNNQPWVFDGPAGADVVWGVRPAASWRGTAALLQAGPGGGCNPCTLTAGNYGGLYRSASEVAIELELGCNAEVVTAPRGFAVTGVRLNLYGSDDHGRVSLNDLPLELTTVGAEGDRCVTDTSEGADTREVRSTANVLEPGRTLDYRIPLGPLVEAAGHDPVYTVIGLYDVQLEVRGSAGATAWIEVGRTLMDGCQ